MAETRGGRFPVKGRTLSDYHVRVERVVDLMRQEPAQQFTLRELAGEAAFSEFHFHRIFRKVAGETVAKCHVRLRLEAAAEALAYDRDASVRAPGRPARSRE